jgi:SAM-dependent methyltransferase
MPIPGLASWFASAQGRYVLDWEQSRTDTTISEVFGFNALQLGLPEIDFLRNSRITRHWHLGLNSQADVLCDFRELPFAAQSIDLVVLPHVLEFYPDPQQIVREVERVLIPEGQAIFLGFNPYSLWGAYRYLPGIRQQGIPWKGHYLSPTRLRDWLDLLGFESEKTIFGAYAPPWSQEKWLRRWHFMEQAGGRWWGMGGGIYLLRATKRVHGMHLLTPNWRRKRHRIAALLPAARPATRYQPPHISGPLSRQED